MALICIVMVVLSISLGASARSKNPLFKTNAEEMSDVKVEVDGQLPTWLQGIYVRNGPGRFGMGDRNFTHAFDGYAKLHSFRFGGNSDHFLFSAQFLRSDSYKSSVAHNTVAPYLLFDSLRPPFSTVEYMTSLYNGIDNTNTNVIQLKSSRHDAARTALIAVSDFWQFYEFDPDTLSCMGRHDVKLPSGGSMFTRLTPVPSTAHPVPEAGTDNYISFYTLMNPVPWLAGSVNLIRITSVAERELISSIRMRDIPYMHSFALTKQYAVLLAHPIYVDAFKMLKNRSPLKSLVWEDGKDTDVFVVDIHSGKQVHLKCQALFFMHVANAYQRGNQIIIDTATYSNLVFLKSLNLDFLETDNPSLPMDSFPTMKRIHINLARRSVTISDFPRWPLMSLTNNFDFPIINPYYIHRRHCYIYGIGVGGHNGSLSDAYIVKKDTCRGGKGDLMWRVVGHEPSEPWFEPLPWGTGEDDGVLMSVVMDAHLRRSYLLVLDARNLVPVSKALLPTIVPFTIHGRMFHEKLAPTNLFKVNG